MVTFLFVTVLFPAMRSSEKNDRREEILQRLILTRETLAGTLPRARFVDVQPDRLSYRLPAVVATSAGSLEKITPLQSIEFAPRLWTLSLQGGALVESAPDGPSHTLWILGPDSSWRVDTSAKPVVTFHFRGLEDLGRPEGRHFEESFALVLANL